MIELRRRYTVGVQKGSPYLWGTCCFFLLNFNLTPLYMAKRKIPSIPHALRETQHAFSLVYYLYD